MHGDEGDEEDAEEGKQRDDTPIAPGVCASTPLQCQEEADNAGQEKEFAEQIKFAQLLADCETGIRRRVWLEDEHDDCDDDPADG